MVARVYRPGCKVDNMTVLEGVQGVGKSSALQIIGGEWFAEQHESATNPKAFAEILQGKLLIEISEMNAFNRAEVKPGEADNLMPIGQVPGELRSLCLDHPRQCVFVGTTNVDDWNRDETGARRFWPIPARASSSRRSAAARAAIRRGREAPLAGRVALADASRVHPRGAGSPLPGRPVARAHQPDREGRIQRHHEPSLPAS
jgi:hypothetical protein